MPLSDLIAQAGQGNPRAIARLITRVENSKTAAASIVPAIYSATGRAHIIGVTGPPGSGKSTLVNALAKELRGEQARVGIIAVDPSSPFTGGALLGDRVRMRDLAGDRGIFIRSLASRGRLGGLSEATAAVIKVLDASGFSSILVETVGAGQAEVDIASTAHTTLVIETPGAGDDVQSIKAGILEIADILVVNKADRPGAARTVRSLQMMLQLGQPTRLRHHGQVGKMDTSASLNTGAGETAVAGDGVRAQAWDVPIQETVATDGTGVADLAARIVAHKAYLEKTDEWLVRERERSRRELEQLLQTRLLDRFQESVPQVERDRWITAVAQRETDPYTAVDAIFAQIAS